MSDNISSVVITDRDGNTIEVYESDIAMYLSQYIDERGIENMRKEPQSRWNAALLYINKHLFQTNRQRLYTDSRQYNAYNIELINSICDVYINLCYEYNKEISIMGFSKLTGINPDTIYTWKKNEYDVSSKSSEIYKKLNTENEESLSGLLISAKQNPVGILAALNRRHGWNMGQPRGTDGTQHIAASRDEIATRAETVAQLPGRVEDLPD